LTPFPLLTSKTEAALEENGSELAETIAAIEARGGIVQRMEIVSVSGYRLGIVWPD